MDSNVVFPTSEQIPEAAKVDASRWARQYLVNGEIRTCSQGRTVLSPICVRKADGSLERVALGETPMLTAAEALEALAAARKAWDSGRG